MKTPPMSREQMMAELAALQKKVASLSILAKVSVKDGPNTQLFMLVREHLKSVGLEDDLDNIVEAFQKAGYVLGKYPRRTVANSVSHPRMSKFFKLTREGQPPRITKVRLLNAGPGYIPANYRSL